MRKLIALATLFAAVLGFAPRADAQAATRPDYLLIGASVPRVAEAEIRARLGPTLQFEAFDARSFVHRDMLGGPTTWEVFWRNYRHLGAGDWLILEMGHGGVDVATNRAYLREVIRLLPDNVCLAVIQPHTYYGSPTAVYVEWNRQMSDMQREVIVGQPCHAQIWWSSAVKAANTIAAPWMTPADAGHGQPYVYDGRHPTPAGSRELAKIIAWVVGIR